MFLLLLLKFVVLVNTAVIHEVLFLHPASGGKCFHVSDSEIGVPVTVIPCDARSSQYFYAISGSTPESYRFATMLLGAPTLCIQPLRNETEELRTIRCDDPDSESLSFRMVKFFAGGNRFLLQNVASGKCLRPEDNDDAQPRVRSAPCSSNDFQQHFVQCFMFDGAGCE